MLVLRDNVTTRLHVQCYPGRKADEIPHCFQLNTHEYFAEEIVDQWYGPKHVFFKLRADDGDEGANLIAIHAQQDAFAGRRGHRADGHCRACPA